MKPLELLISELCPNGVEYIKIGNFAIQMNGMSGVSNKWKDTGNCRFIDYMNVYKNISVNVEDLPFATVKSLAKQTILKKGDILFTSASETPLECAISSNIEGELPDGILLDDHLFAIRIKTEWKNKISPSFIIHYFFFFLIFHFPYCKLFIIFYASRDETKSFTDLKTIYEV